MLCSRQKATSINNYDCADYKYLGIWKPGFLSFCPHNTKKIDNLLAN